MGDITDATLERVGVLVADLARVCGRTNTEVARALLESMTMANVGYLAEQDGHLTEDQGQVAVRLLEHWIRKRGGG